MCVLPLVLVAVGSCTEGGGPAAACERPVVAVNRNGIEDGLAEIVLADPSGEAELVTGDWVATEPSFSPDGRRLAVVRADTDYESSGPSVTELWIVDLSGGERRGLTIDALDAGPAWSPDGASIAFSRWDGTTTKDQIAVVSVETSEVRTLTAGDGPRDLDPAWSPDGDLIAFIREVGLTDVGRDTEVWTVRPDGTGAQRLVAVPNAQRLDWAPDGRSLLISTFDLERGEVLQLDLESRTPRTLAGDATLAVWSPAGQDVYFFTKQRAPQRSWWQLARGRIVDGRLEVQETFAEGADYLYPYFGLDVRSCP